MTRIAGSATPEATRAYAERMLADRGVVPSSYRPVDGLTASTVGLGTYLGDADDETDVLYVEAVVEAVRLGCNVVDTAVNYRFQRSERAVGAALARLVASGEVERSEVVVATKGGYVPFDGDRPASPAAARAYVERTFVESGVCRPEDFAVRMQHCMAPGYLAHQIDQSRENLGLERLDVYYIHNPEGQIPEVGPGEFERRMRAAFELLERKVAEGAISRYGTATWSGFREDPDAAGYLSLERLVRLAREVAGEGHHFRVVQLPYNLSMTEAFGSYNQSVGGDATTLLDAARQLGVAVFASASLLQARLADRLPDELADLHPDGTSAQRALQFVRSTPGIGSALVGMSRTAHVRENLALLRVPPLPADAIRAMFEDV